MFQVRLHGRGGQGVVTSAELLSIAAFDEGRHAQAFPSFGSERMGAPVVAFCRIDDKEIRLREPVASPDAVVVGDPTLLHSVDLFGGLQPSGYILINSARDFAGLGMAEFVSGFRPERCATVPATDIAMRLVGRPLPNAALLGSLAALTGVLEIESVVKAILERFKGAVGNANAQAAREAFEHVRTSVKERQAIA
jgi:pyruvate ferredoxin oxidoreductase gamma subunit